MREMLSLQQQMMAVIKAHLEQLHVSITLHTITVTD